MLSSIWIIPALPLLGFLLNGLFGKRLGRGFVTLVGPGTILCSFLIALARFMEMLKANNHVVEEKLYSWISVGSFHVDLAFRIDQLSGLMVLIITGVGFLIHVYSTGYMWEEKSSYYRFFCYLNLFIFFMLLLVLGENFLVMFLGWEGVGLCSYLLIGYYTDKKSAGDAAKKAFIANRVGDAGFIIAMLITLNISIFGSLSFEVVNTAAKSFILEGGALNQAMLAEGSGFLGLSYGEAFTLITFFLFVGACGKSAQIPLYVWLPDAMEGPTPVSALIHAATMVTSGLYLIARLSHLFILSPTTLSIVAIVGAVTALFGATIGLAQYDIKKVLAYSTVSQLGYMFLAMGVGAFGAGMFHVMTHAFFKALLFLGSGSVIHGMHHEQDMRKMGGLKAKMPVTWFTYAVGTWAIAGLPIAAGFFSKDEILWYATSSPLGNWGLWTLGFLAAGCTSFYMYRSVNMTFHGKFRGGDHAYGHVHESPWNMTLPLLILAVLAAGAGLLGIPHIFAHHANVMENYFEGFFAQMPGPLRFGDGYEWALMIASVGLAAVGFWYARKCYIVRPDIPEKAYQIAPGLHKLLNNKYYVDEIYDAWIIRPLQNFSTKYLWKAIDAGSIDGLVNICGIVAQGLGNSLRRIQTGVLQHYGLIMILGIVCVISFFF